MDAKVELLSRKKTEISKISELKLIENLATEVRFEVREIYRIMSILKEYMNDLEFIDAAIFSEILHNSLGFLNDFSIKRVFYAADVHKNRRITREDFIRVLSVMLRGTLKEKIKLCFTCFDISDNLELTREDVIFLLLEAVSEPPTKDATTDALRDLVEMIFTKMDEDGDGVITIEEFEKVCIKDWTLMEMFGECLPDYRHRAAFLVLLESDQEIKSDKTEK